MIQPHNASTTEQLKQPKAMLPLCTTEMWERFGFYIVQGMLIFLLTKHFNLSQSESILLTGEYGALVYISPILGGYFADNYLGFRYSILVGACFQCIGYLLVSTLAYSLLFWGLACVILGNGFLKPNIASYLGEFYEPFDARRQAGFTYYYMIMNLGIFLSTFSAGFIQRTFGWHICFIAAAVGMSVGVTIFLGNLKRFDNKGLPPRPHLFQQKKLAFLVLSLVGCALILTACNALLHHPAIGNKILLGIAILVFIYLFFLALRFEGQERCHLIALIWLIAFTVVFWAIYFEMFSVINLFVEYNVDRVFFHITWPAIAFMSLEAVFIVVLGLPLALLWKRLHRKNKNPNIALKLASALLISALAMWLLRYAIYQHTAQYLVMPIWMLFFYLLITLGEMLLSPNVLAAVTEFSPRKVVGLMMGVQYIALGFGSAITGIIGQFAAIPKGQTNPMLTNAIYAHAFMIYALICVVTGLIILMSAPVIKRLLTTTA